MQALDYGEGGKLVAWGPRGEIEFPRLPSRPRGSGPRSQAEKFAEKLAWLLEQDDVVFEQSTPGTSGADRDLIAKVAASAGHRIYLVSVRAVKSLARDRDMPREITDAEAAQLIYDVAMKAMARKNHDGLTEYYPDSNKIERKFTSVRPYDKHDYRHPQVDEWMSVVPAFDDLPEGVQKVFAGSSDGFSRAAILPFAMAMFEPAYDGTRRSFEKIIGLHGHGAPSFYRRKSIEVMQDIAKKSEGLSHFSDVSPQARKAAWKEARRIIRALHSAMRDNWPAGTIHP